LKTPFVFIRFSRAAFEVPIGEPMKLNRLTQLVSTTALALGLAATACGGDDTSPSGDGDGDGDGDVPGDGDGDGDGDDPQGGPGIEPLAIRMLDNAINPYGATFSEDGYLYISGTVDTSAVDVAQTGADLRLAVWRFTEDNTLDSAFGENGVAVSDIANPGTSYDIVELSDGTFAVHMSDGAFGVALTRLDVSDPAAPTFSAPTTIEFGWTAANRAELNAACSAAATAYSDASAACEAVDQEDGPCDEDGAGPDEEACDTLQTACDALDSAGDECRTIWPLATAPLFAERPSNGSSWGIGLDSSGANEKIVVFAHGPAEKVSTGTQRTDTDRFITRVLASDFSFDPSFNDGAVFSLDANGAGLNDNSRRGLVEADGSILSAGYTPFGGNNHVNLVRLLPDGTLDPEFGFSDDQDAYPWTGGYTHFNPFDGPGQTDGMAEAYSVIKVADGTYVTTGYGKSYFETGTIENDLVSFRILPDGLDTTWGGNAAGDAKFGSFAVQSETDLGAGIGTRPYRENGRDLIALPDGRTLQVGCYDDFASIFVVTNEGKLDENVGAGTGRIQYTHPFPFFKIAISKDGTRVAATAQSRPKVITGSPVYARSFLVTLAVDVE
jgi:hypothetical protein